jgi:hypothetical protein
MRTDPNARATAPFIVAPLLSIVHSAALTLPTLTLQRSLCTTHRLGSDSTYRAHVISSSLIVHFNVSSLHPAPSSSFPLCVEHFHGTSTLRTGLLLVLHAFFPSGDHVPTPCRHCTPPIPRFARILHPRTRHLLVPHTFLPPGAILCISLSLACDEDAGEWRGHFFKSSRHPPFTTHEQRRQPPSTHLPRAKPPHS